MKLKRIGQAAAVLSIGALGLAACGQANNPGASDSATSGSAGTSGSATSVTGTLSGSGATSQEAAISAWQTGIATSQPNLAVQYNPVGSGAGRKAFLAGQVAFAGSDAAMEADEQTEAKAICGPDGALNIPAYVSPIAVAFNVDGVKTLNLDAATIAKIFAGKITTWNDPAIAEANKDVTLPDTKITVVHCSDKSGTTKNFTEYLTAAAAADWTPGVVEEWPADLGGESAQGTGGVVKLLGTTAGSIGYADLSAATTLGKVSVKVGETYQEPSEAAAAKNVELAKRTEGDSANNMALTLDRTSTEAGSYPIILVSYHIYCSTYKEQSTVDMIKAWGTYVVSPEGQKAAEAAAGSAPLSAAMSEQATKAIATITVAK